MMCAALAKSLLTFAMQADFNKTPERNIAINAVSNMFRKTFYGIMCELHLVQNKHTQLDRSMENFWRGWLDQRNIHLAIDLPQIKI